MPKKFIKFGLVFEGFDLCIVLKYRSSWRVRDLAGVVVYSEGWMVLNDVEPLLSYLEAVDSLPSQGLFVS